MESDDCAMQNRLICVLRACRKRLRLAQPSPSFRLDSHVLMSKIHPSTDAGAHLQQHGGNFEADLYPALEVPEVCSIGSD
jgi:hypothetical protein